jgi:hypothetical protein
MPTRRRHFGSVRKLPSGRWQASYWHQGIRHVAADTFPATKDGETISAWAVQKSNIAKWRGRRTRADDVAAALLAYQERFKGPSSR